MTEPSRLRVIEGGETPKPNRPRKRTPEDDTAHQCQCGATALVKARVDARDVGGKLRGGADWWCCLGCQRAHYHVRDYD